MYKHHVFHIPLAMPAGGLPIDWLPSSSSEREGRPLELRRQQQPRLRISHGENPFCLYRHWHSWCPSDVDVAVALTNNDAVLSCELRDSLWRTIAVPRHLSCEYVTDKLRMSWRHLAARQYYIFHRTLLVRGLFHPSQIMLATDDQLVTGQVKVILLSGLYRPIRMF